MTLLCCVVGICARAYDCINSNIFLFTTTRILKWGGARGGAKLSQKFRPSSHKQIKKLNFGKVATAIMLAVKLIFFAQLYTLVVTVALFEVRRQPSKAFRLQRLADGV